MAFASRAIGGAFGSAVLDAIINGYIAEHLVCARSAAPQLLRDCRLVSTRAADAFDAGTGFDAVDGLNATILDAATGQRAWTYAHAYRLGWSQHHPISWS